MIPEAFSFWTALCAWLLIFSIVNEYEIFIQFHGSTNIALGNYIRGTIGWHIRIKYIPCITEIVPCPVLYLPFSHWTIICLSTSLDQKTSDIYSKNSIYSSVQISTAATWIIYLISNLNFSWRVELLMEYQNNYLCANIVVPGLGYSWRFFLGVSTSYPGGLLGLY